MVGSIETTLVLIKPDGVDRGLIVPILDMLIGSGDLRIVGLKMIPSPVPERVQEHYLEHKGQPYYDWLCKQLETGPLVAIALRGEDIVARVRAIIGPREPEKNPTDGSTIRGRFANDRFDTSKRKERAVRNQVHAASSLADAARELGLWFNPSEII